MVGRNASPCCAPRAGADAGSITDAARTRAPLALPRFRNLRAALVLCAVTAGFWGYEPRAAAAQAPSPANRVPAAEPVECVMHLTNESVLRGVIEDSEESGIVRVRCPSFVEPFEIRAEAIAAIKTTRHAVRPPWPAIAARRPSGDFCFELTNEDALFGTLQEMTDTGIVIESSTLGRVRVLRSDLRRMARQRGGSRLLYLGPNGIEDWSVSRAANAPRVDRRRGVAARAGETLFADLGIPARAFVEIELSWDETPDFTLELGTDNAADGLPPTLVYDSWGDKLVACCESGRDVDITTVDEFEEGRGQVRLLACIDQASGRAFVFSPIFNTLVELAAGGDKHPVRPGIRLKNLRSSVRLELLRITEWDGKVPERLSMNETLVLYSGGILEGPLCGFDAATREFVARSDSKETRIPEEEIESICFAAATTEERPLLQATWSDGTRLSGDVLKVLGPTLWLQSRALEEPVAARFEDLCSLFTIHQQKLEPLRQGREGRLEVEDSKMLGILAPACEDSRASCLAWQPAGARAAVALRSGSSGEIVYRERKREPKPTPQDGRANRKLRGGIVVFPGQNLPQETPRTEKVHSRRSLHLRTGDKVPCEVLRIDEEGVYCKTVSGAEVLVPHNKVTAIELMDSYPVVRLDEKKRQRILTLPRVQKANPPTHLIFSELGDILRGRVIAMNAENLEVELRLETRLIPRDRVARILWLRHDTSIDGNNNGDPAGEVEAETELPAVGTRVQALGANGVRQTFQATEMTGSGLSGKSDLLGACSVAISDVDRILFGDAIQASVADDSTDEWRLKDALAPHAATEGGSAEGNDSGTESSLVGKPAPDFRLVLMDGKEFRLADAKGTIVVLDFWATWCGPCLRAMPAVESVVKEFEVDGVRLIAINMGEKAKDILRVIQHLELDVAVALDLDCTVAEKYAVRSIPQTVVIDREGKIARVFVGAGPGFPDRLREALRKVAASKF